MTPIEKLNTIQELTSGTIYLMGGSFILGSMFTLLLLLLLDFMRDVKDKKGSKS